MATIPEELLDIVGRLPTDQQRRVLDFARDLAAHPSQASTLPPGKPASELLSFRPTLTPEEAESMRQAIEEGCRER